MLNPLLLEALFYVQKEGPRAVYTTWDICKKSIGYVDLPYPEWSRHYDHPVIQALESLGWIELIYNACGNPFHFKFTELGLKWIGEDDSYLSPYSSEGFAGDDPLSHGW